MTTQTPTEILLRAAKVARETKAIHHVRTVRHLGVIHSIELSVECAMEVGFELDHIASIVLNDDEVAVLLDRHGSAVDPDGDDLPTASDAVMTTTSLSQWVPELMA